MADLLRTDYKDDILNTDVNTQRKYRMVQNDDGTVSFEDVTAYTQVGDSFGAADINKTNLAIGEVNNALSSLIKTADYSVTIPGLKADAGTSVNIAIDIPKNSTIIGIIVKPSDRPVIHNIFSYDNTNITISIFNPYSSSRNETETQIRVIYI